MQDTHRCGFRITFQLNKKVALIGSFLHHMQSSVCFVYLKGSKYASFRQAVWIYSCCWHRHGCFELLYVVLYFEYIFSACQISFFKLPLLCSQHKKLRVPDIRILRNSFIQRLISMYIMKFIIVSQYSHEELSSIYCSCFY